MERAQVGFDSLAGRKLGELPQRQFRCQVLMAEVEITIQYIVSELCSSEVSPPHYGD